MPRTKRLEVVTEMAREMYEAFETWYDAHPDATFEEIEEEGRRLRRQLMGQVFEILINGRDTGVGIEPPCCAQCGREMTFEGYNRWLIRGLEGDTTLERAYYLCPECQGQRSFPPGSQTTTTS